MSSAHLATALVVPFEHLRMTDVESVGGKNASLGEMISQLAASGVRVLSVDAHGESYAKTLGHWIANLLENTDATDFGREVIPGALDKYRVNSYLFRGFWADVGTVESFYDAMEQHEPELTALHRLDAPGKISRASRDHFASFLVYWLVILLLLGRI